MKKLYILLFLTFSISSFSQISEIKVIKPPVVIGEWNMVGYLVAKIEYRVYNEGDTTYTFTYRDSRYSSIFSYESFSFDGASALNGFYDLIMTCYNEQNNDNYDYKFSFKIGESNLYISQYRNMGHWVCISEGGSGYVYLSKRGIQKTFGRF